jgi:hypothetical protein
MKDEMDGQSAVFGKITRGIELLDAMNGNSTRNPGPQTQTSMFWRARTYQPRLSKWLKPPTPNPQPSTINHQSSTLNHQPSTLNHQPSTINPQPSTISPQPSTISHQPSTINHQPSTLNHQPSAISHQPSTLNRGHFEVRERAVE